MDHCTYANGVNAIWGKRARRAATWLAVVLFICPRTRAADELTASNNPAAPRPVLTNAIQIIEMPADQARLSNHVSITGVMTFVDPHSRYGFVQDETSGAVVFWTNQTLPASAGEIVHVEGRVFPNLYAPVIGNSVIQDIGPGEFPNPLPVSFVDLRAGRADCQWVELEGRVRSATMATNDFFVLIVDVEGRRLKVSVYAPSRIETAGWVNSDVRIHGVSLGSFNNKGQLITSELVVPSISQVRTLVPARSNPYTQPVTSLAVFGHKAEKRPGDRIRVQGCVTLFLPGEALYVREGTNSIEVRTSETGGAEPGDMLDIVGFYEKSDHAPIIEDATFRRLSTGSVPAPRAVSMDDIAAGLVDAELVTLSARVLEWRHGPAERSILLQASNNVIFRAHLNNSESGAEIPVGSLVQVTGVCLISVDANLDVRSFDLRLRSANDLALVESPPWWTTPHVIWVAAALLLAGVMAGGWGAVLKGANVRLERRVAERTAELAQSVERFRKLAAFLPVGVFETDLRGICTYVNRRGAEISGGAIDIPSDTPWMCAVHPDDRAEVERTWAEAASAGKPWAAEFRLVRAGGECGWVNCLASPRQDMSGEKNGYVATLEDISQRKQSEAALEEAHKKLVGSSRLAGMAEVATSVLHNVGNVLTSINISSSMMMERVRNSKVANVGKAAALIQEHAADLPGFFAVNPKGRRLPGYLSGIADLLAKDHAELMVELKSLADHIEHINEIIATQQNYARVPGVAEELPATILVEDALRMNLDGIDRQGIKVIRAYGPVPAIKVDKHKALQILVNLIRNAKHACHESKRADKQITLEVGLNGGGCVKIAVIDNGVGIPRENLTRIFAHGFTTRKDGHGFGLHSGALAAKELGGALRVQSDGPGRGAVFILELPIQDANGG